jgi:hypothetical protein
MTLMWEAKAADGRGDDLLSWALENTPAEASVYRSVDGRVVVIDETDTGLPDTPAELVARSPHVWRFARVRP